MQHDGNLTVRDAGGNTWGASDTPMLNSGNYLLLRADGNLILCTGEDKVLRETRTAWRGGEELHMQEDRNLVLIGKQGPVWASGGFGWRWAPCLPDTEGCICGTIIANAVPTVGEDASG
jgi:hypothetical protein